MFCKDAEIETALSHCTRDARRNVKCSRMKSTRETHTEIQNTPIDFSTSWIYAPQVCTSPSELETVVPLDSGAHLVSNPGYTVSRVLLG